MRKTTSHQFIFGVSVIFLFCFSLKSLAQSPGNPNVDAGPDITLDCDAGPCTDLTAIFVDIGETNVYDVQPIDYAPPFPFNGLANSLNPNMDDRWSPVESLPFDFCFFDEIQTQFQVGSNGVIRFDVDPNDTTNAWPFSADLPNNTEEALSEANVFTPVHDIDPSASSTEEIGYEVIGDAPNRVLVVSYFEVPMFSTTCNNLLATQMVVFYETTNIIDIYIQDKPSCPSWNSGNAALGIQNNDGTVAYVPAGRNTSDSPWDTNNEAWRFTPTGDSVVEFAWLDSDGNVIGTDTTINVCPNGNETYTAQVTYTNCNDDVVVVTDDVTVTIEASFSVDIGEDQAFCDEDSYDITAAITGGNPDDATFLWSNGETTETITVTQSNDYFVEVTIDGCTVTSNTVSIQFIEGPEFDLGEDIETCGEEVILDATPSNFDPSEVNFEWFFDGNVIAGETGPMLAVTEGGTYSVTVSEGECSITDSVSIIPRDDLEVTVDGDFKSCPNEMHILTATTEETDVTYQWFLNGEGILNGDSASLEIIVPEGSTGILTYSVVITAGGCTGTDSVDVALYDVGNCVISQGLSPNNDGFNDKLDLEFLADRSGISKLQIYNRLGGLVYDQVNYINEWNGQSKDGNVLPTGTYFYVINFISQDPLYGTQATGWIYVNQDSN